MIFLNLFNISVSEWLRFICVNRSNIWDWSFPWFMVFSKMSKSFIDNDIFVPTLRIGIPDKLVDHATPQQSKESLGLTPEMMADQIRNKFNFN